MSILKIKNALNQWEGIPMLKGEPGEATPEYIQMYEEVATAKTFVNDKSIEVAENAQIASAKAQQATEERERIEGLDVYTKAEAHNTFSNALIGTANGETIEIADVQPNTDFRSVVLKGETKEVGTGDKSPDNPYVLEGVENAIITVADGTNTDEYPITTPPLYSLPDGTKDTFDVVSGNMLRSLGFDKFSGSENWTVNMAYQNQVETIVFSLPLPTAKPGWTIQTGVMSCFNWRNNNQIYYEDTEGFNITSSPNLVIRVNRSHLATEDAAGFKSWLAAQNTAGTPVMALYQLATPTTSQLAPITIPTYSPTSIISTDQGSLEVEYNRDINKVLADLQAQINALTALGGML
jgi:hypothetical protein